jgi:hypothetical protein
MVSPFAKLAASVCGLTDPSSGRCPFCGRHDARWTIRDDESLREFEISGICQQCQDRTFGREAES